MPSENCTEYKEYQILINPWYNVDNFVNEMINYLQQGVTNTATWLSTDLNLINGSLKSNRIYASLSCSHIYNGAGNFRGKQNEAARNF